RRKRLPPQLTRMTKTYSARIGWLVLLLVVVAIVPLVCGGVLLPGSLKRGIVLLAVGGFNLAFFFVLALPVTYTVSATELEIRSGVMRSRIPLQDIASIAP